MIYEVNITGFFQLPKEGWKHPENVSANYIDHRDKSFRFAEIYT